MAKQQKSVEEVITTICLAAQIEATQKRGGGTVLYSDPKAPNVTAIISVGATSTTVSYVEKPLLEVATDLKKAAKK